MKDLASSCVEIALERRFNLILTSATYRLCDLEQITGFFGLHFLCEIIITIFPL